MQNILTKHLFIIILFLTLGNLYANNITIIVKEIEDKEGDLYLTICNEEAFNINNDTSKCIAQLKQKINGALEYSYSFSNIAEGEWAVFGYIDTNNNNILDSNIMGIPKETVLFTKPLKGVPKFNYIKSIINKDTQTIILLAQ